MAAKKKRSKAETRALVQQMRERFLVSGVDDLAACAAKVRGMLEAYRAEGFEAALAKDVPLSSFLAEHGGDLVVPASAPFSSADLDRIEGALGAPVPSDFQAMFARGGFWAFAHNPDAVVKTLPDADTLISRMKVVEGLLERPASPSAGDRVVDGAIDTWTYGLSGVLPATLRRDPKLLPLAPYWGDDYGVYFAAVHLVNTAGHSPVFCAKLAHGDVVFYAHGAAGFMQKFTNVTMSEIALGFA